MFLRVSLLFLGAMLVECGPTQINQRGPVHIPRKPPLAVGETKEVFPTENLHPDVVEGIQSFGDAFELQRCIELELTDDSALAEVTELLFFHRRIYVLDRTLGEVLMFDENGRFLGPFGRRGQGPGEYEIPMGLTVWNDRIAMINNARKQNLAFYDYEGRFIEGVNLRQFGLLINGHVVFDGDKVVLARFPAMLQATPAHAIVDLTSIREPKVLYGFGKRPAHYFLSNGQRNWKMPDWPDGGFHLVDGRIWHTAPCSSYIEVFSKDGELLARLPSGLDGIRLSDFDGLTDADDVRRVMGEKFKAFQFAQAGPYVLACYLKKRWKASLFDINGHLLVRDLPHDRIPIWDVRQTNGQQLAFYLPVDQYYWENALEMTLKDDFVKLLDAGYDPARREDYNPWILIYHPRTKAS